jgi:putative DNA modification/repair radical SAM protein
MDISEKVGILADAAKYDASCSTSGSARANSPGGLGSGAVCGICHSWSQDGRCVALLKVLLSNACAYNCAYCVNRRTNDIQRASFEPEELVKLIIDFYKRNYIEGAFLSSGVVGCPDATMERLIWIAKTLRTREHYNGYIHLKVIPGASDSLVMEAAAWADRVSVNIELPSAKSLALIAPDKKPEDIFHPMRTLAIAGGYEPQRLSSAYIVKDAHESSYPVPALRPVHISEPRPIEIPKRTSVKAARRTRNRNPNAGVLPAGQTTQLVVGASPESDAVILTLAENLYLAYDVRRVYYSAFIPTGNDSRLPVISSPPLDREHRLYQADWLFRFYGFTAGEILDASKPFLDPRIDPKSDWALRNLHFFPIEIRTAEYLDLLRVPGIGPKSASRIVAARRKGRLTTTALSKMGVVMRRAQWFITLYGAMASRQDPASFRGITKMLERPEFLRGELLDPSFRKKELMQPELPWR